MIGRRQSLVLTSSIFRCSIAVFGLILRIETTSAADSIKPVSQSHQSISQCITATLSGLQTEPANAQVRRASGKKQWKNGFLRLLHKTNGPFFRFSSLSKTDKSILSDIRVHPDSYPSDPAKFFTFIVSKARAVGSDHPEIETAINEYQEKALPNLAKALQPLHGGDTSGLKGREDSEELIRGFGYLLLPRWDRAFNEPKYVSNLLRQRSQTANGYPKFDPNDSKRMFDRAFSRLSQGLDHKVVPVAHTLTGSDANNLFQDVANWVVSIKKGKRAQGHVLIFDDSYVAARGPMRMYRFFDRDGNPGPWDEFLIPSPDTWHSIDPSDLGKPLNEKEIKALESIESKFKARDDIGGILIEPILTAKGVYFYRPNFMKALSDLARRLNIPVLADEIFNAGGRTGQPFSYLHYPGFVPDYVTYGKGIGSAGLAEVRRSSEENPFLISKIEETVRKTPKQFGLQEKFPFKFYDSTIENTADSFLKASVIINRIVDDRLIENASKSGQHFKERLRWFQVDFQNQNPDGFEERNRSLGLLFGISNENRYAPAITLSKEDVDRIFRDRVLFIFEDRIGQREQAKKYGHFPEFDPIEARRELALLKNASPDLFFEKAKEMRKRFFGKVGTWSFKLTDQIE
jgi:4-aminobutyrate aminotransferase-like enzyme